MRRTQGFTLIELMITVVVVAILAAVAFPSYQDHIRRGVRSQGQQFLSDVAQRQEQFFLDNRNYAATLAILNLTPPTAVSDKYQAPVFTVVAAAVGTPPSFRINLPPIASGLMANDGTLVINNLQQRWRSATVADTAYNTPGDCLWEDSRCNPS